MDHSDQTNCSDVERIGGHCLIDGFMSSVSTFVVCDSEFRRTIKPTKLCDDNLEDACLTPSSELESGCVVHKHKMCDGVRDCPTGGDEFNDTCTLTMKNFYCDRTFNSNYDGSSAEFPMSWIMDNERDCENGEDESEFKWKFCDNIIEMTRFAISSTEECQNAFLCPG